MTSSQARRYRVDIKPSARRAAQRLPARARVRLVAAIDALGDNPRPDGCKKVAGVEHLYRARVGDYRIVYEVHDEVLHVLVIRVGHRSDVYRGL